MYDFYIHLYTISPMNQLYLTLRLLHGSRGWDPELNPAPGHPPGQVCRLTSTPLRCSRLNPESRHLPAKEPGVSFGARGTLYLSVCLSVSVRPAVCLFLFETSPAAHLVHTVDAFVPSCPPDLCHECTAQRPLGHSLVSSISHELLAVEPWLGVAPWLCVF